MIVSGYKLWLAVFVLVLFFDILEKYPQTMENVCGLYWF